MGYHSSVGNTTAAVTTDNTSAIAIACPTTSTVQWQTADLAVTTTSSPGAGNVSTIYDVTNSGGNDTTYVAKVVLEPSYQVGSGLLASGKPETMNLRSACHAMPLGLQCRNFLVAMPMHGVALACLWPHVDKYYDR